MWIQLKDIKEQSLPQIKTISFGSVWRILVIHRLASNGIWQSCGSLSCTPWCYLPVVRMQCSLMWATPGPDWGEDRNEYTVGNISREFTGIVEYWPFKLLELWMKPHSSDEMWIKSLHIPAERWQNRKRRPVTVMILRCCSFNKIIVVTYLW